MEPGLEVKIELCIGGASVINLFTDGTGRGFRWDSIPCTGTYMSVINIKRG